MSDPVISFRNLDIVFGDAANKALPLLDSGKSREKILEETGQLVGVSNITLDIEQGELLVLMGLSGSGKSSLLRAINGLNKATRGETLVCDGNETINPSTCTASRLRKLRRNRIAMVFQQFGLLPWRTVYENVGFSLELSRVPKKERRQRIEEQLSLVGLDGWGDQYVHELSGGMQQRVGLARAFATQAPILLMDEPFSALDPLIRTHLQDELLALQAQLHKTIVFVSHDLDEAAKIGNRIAIMESGQVVQVGTAQEIVRNPIDDYVESFVAQMNPLNVLRARDIMRPLEDGVPVESNDHYLECPADLSIRSLIELKQGKNKPLLVMSDSKPVGFIDEEEILASLI